MVVGEMRVRPQFGEKVLILFTHEGGGVIPSHPLCASIAMWLHIYKGRKRKASIWNLIKAIMANHNTLECYLDNQPFEQVS